MFTSIKSALAIGLFAAALHHAPAQAQANPLDRVGIEHNVYLGCVMQNGATEGLEPLIALVEICGFDAGTSTDEFVQTWASWVDAVDQGGVARGMSTYRSEFSDEQFAYFARIDRVLTTSDDVASADAAFARIEADAIAQLRSGTPAEQSVLAALSTARNSLRYWAAREGLRSKGGAHAKRKIWDVLMVVGADLLGAAGGTLIGGPVLGGVIGAASSAGAAAVLRPH